MNHRKTILIIVSLFILGRANAIDFGYINQKSTATLPEVFSGTVTVTEQIVVGEGNGKFILEQNGGLYKTNGYGYLQLMRTANYPQIYLGYQGGTVAGYIDVDNNAPMLLNVLDNGEIITSSGGLRPENNNSTHLGTSANAWEKTYTGTVRLTLNINPASAPEEAGILGADSSYVLYISTGTGTGAWVKIGGQ